MAAPLTTAEVLDVTYCATQDAGCALAHVLGVLDAGKAMGLPVDGNSLIEALERVQASIVRARDAAGRALILAGYSG